MTEPGWREELYLAVTGLTARGQARNWHMLQEHREALEEVRESARAIEDQLRQRQADLLDQLERLARDREEERRSLEGQLAGTREELEARRREVAQITGTRTWRWRSRLLRTPVGRLLRRRGAERSRPAAS